MSSLSDSKDIKYKQLLEVAQCNISKSHSRTSGIGEPAMLGVKVTGIGAPTVDEQDQKQPKRCRRDKEDIVDIDVMLLPQDQVNGTDTNGISRSITQTTDRIGGDRVKSGEIHTLTGDRHVSTRVEEERVLGMRKRNLTIDCLRLDSNVGEVDSVTIL